MQQKVAKWGNEVTFRNSLSAMKFTTMLFVSILVSLAALSASYGYARRDLGAPDRPMWATTIEDLKQICGLKLATAAQYEQAAACAPNNLQMQLYNALSHSEHIHVRNYMRALNKLGSRYVRRALAPEVGKQLFQLPSLKNLSTILSLPKPKAQQAQKWMISKR